LRVRLRTFTAAAALVALAAAAARAQAPPLQAQAERILEGASGTWGAMAWSIDGGRVLFAVNAREPLTPASNNKVITSAWALDLLGADHRFATELLVAGPVRDGVLEGDVILRGSGDPAFGYPEFEDEPMDPLLRMAERLRSLGVQMVRGGVIGDATAFDTVQIGPGWPRDTGGGAAYYAPRVSGLAFQRNLVRVHARSEGGQVQITLDPPVEVVPVENAARAGGGRGWAVREADRPTIQVRGAISSRGNQRFMVGVYDPALFTADALRQALLQAGIQVQGPARVAPTPEGATLVHRHLSIPLGAMIPKLNRESDNFFAEHLWKAAVREAVGEGSYVRGGPASALYFMRRTGISAGELYQFDGSGLSSHNRASANSLVRVLVYAHAQPYSDIFHRSMAVAASSDGTLRRLFRGTAAAENLHAKTGYINNVRALSGYVRAANGELIAFSFLYNGRNTFGARDVQTELGVLLANYGGSGAAAGSGSP
jgi:D-alanyl-D-alanine carboxypeptidase/D-alanyl-D-alanine-endopeptidase (penicillin-binding protein 4)